MTNKYVFLVRLAFSSLLFIECKFCIMFGFGGTMHFVNIVQHTMHFVQCTMHYTLWTRHYALDALRTVHYALCTWCTSYNALCTWCTLYKTLMHLCANWHLCERRWASSRNVIMNTTARIRIIMNTARIWIPVITTRTNSNRASTYTLYACEHINQVCTVRINQILIKPQFYGQDMYVGNWSTLLVLPFLLLSYTHTHTKMFRISN